MKAEKQLKISLTFHAIVKINQTILNVKAIKTFGSKESLKL